MDRNSLVISLAFTFLALAFVSPALAQFEELNLTPPTHRGVNRDNARESNFTINITQVNESLIFYSTEGTSGAFWAARIVNTTQATVYTTQNEAVRNKSVSVAGFDSGIYVEHANFVITQPATTYQYNTTRPFNVSRSFVLAYPVRDSDSGKENDAYSIFANFTNETQVFLSRTNGTSNMNVSLQVVELLCENCSVVHGVEVISGTGTEVFVDLRREMDRNRTFAILQLNATSSDILNDIPRLQWAINQTNSTNFRIFRGGGSSADLFTIAWYAIECPACNVSQADFTIGAGTATGTVDIVPMVGREINLTRAAIYRRSFGTTSGTLFSGFNMISFHNSTHLYFSRVGTAQAIGVIAQIIEFPVVLAPAGGAQQFDRTVDDLLALEDLEDRDLSASRDATDGLGYVDFDGRTFSGQREALDNYAYADLAARIAALNRAAADQADYADLASRTATFHRSSEDILAFIVLSVFERIGGAQQFDRTVSDLIALQDEALRQALLSRALLDTFAFVDAASRQFSATRTGDDSFSFIDEGGRVFSGTRTSLDILVFTDEGGRQLTFQRAGRDVFVLVDDAGRELIARRITASTFSFLDDSGRTIVVTRTGPDSIIYVDGSGRTFTAVRGATDSILLQDEGSKQRSIFREVTDSVIFRETAQRSAVFIRLAGDLLSFLAETLTAGGQAVAVPAPGDPTSGPSPPSFFFEFPSANGSFLGLFTFEFERELVLLIEMKQNITPTVVLSEQYLNNFGSSGVENLTRFRIWNVDVQPGHELAGMLLNLSYSEEFLNRSAFREETLAWYSFDRSAGRWVRETTFLDLGSNLVYARTARTGFFAVFGERDFTLPDNFLGTGRTIDELRVSAEVALVFVAAVVVVVWLYVRRARKKALKRSVSTVA